MVVWLVGHLIDCVVGQWVGWLVGWLVSWMGCCLVGCLVSSLLFELISCLSVHWLVCRLVNQSAAVWSILVLRLIGIFVWPLSPSVCWLVRQSVVGQ